MPWRLKMWDPTNETAVVYTGFYQTLCKTKNRVFIPDWKKILATLIRSEGSWV